MLNSPKTKTLSDGLIERTASLLDKIESKTVHKKRKKIYKGKRSKTMSEIKPVKNRGKNLQSFPEISPVQKEALTLHKLRDHACG